MLMKDNEEKRERGGENQFTVKDEKTHTQRERERERERDEIIVTYLTSLTSVHNRSCLCIFCSLKGVTAASFLP